MNKEDLERLSFRNPKVEERLSPGKGKGIFSSAPIAEGEVIGVSHLMIPTQYGAVWPEIAVVRTYHGALLNHTSFEHRVNVEYAQEDAGDILVFSLVAARDIPPNQELLLQYGMFSEPPEVN